MIDQSLEHKFKRVEENFIGLWRFRTVKEKPLWCATYHFNGYYYDIKGQESIEDVLNIMHRQLVILEEEYSQANA